MTLPLPAGVSPDAIDVGDFAIIEQNGRVLYPAISPGRFNEIASGILGEAGFGDIVPRVPSKLNVSFLFTGDELLQLTVLTPRPQQITLTPTPPRRPRDFDRAMNEWWKDYNAVVRRQQRDGDYPPIVETYLTSMLAGRFRAQAAVAHADAGVGTKRIGEPVRFAVRCRGSAVRGDAGDDAGRRRTWRTGDDPLAAGVELAADQSAGGGAESGDRADRHARSGRVFLHQVRQLRELPLVRSSQGRLWRQHQPDGDVAGT